MVRRACITSQVFLLLLSLMPRTSGYYTAYSSYRKPSDDYYSGDKNNVYNYKGGNSYYSSKYSNQYQNSNGNYGSSNSWSSSSSSNGDNYHTSTTGYNYGTDEGIDFTVCQDSVVKVTYLVVSCDSPYTFYYGNGAHRHSKRCDYGDKATLTATFKVVDNLQEGDNIYITMAVYDDANSLLVTTDPEYLCNKYVGYDCVTAGTYTFITTLRLGVPSTGNRTKFYPEIRMAFSTKGDAGYNLGAINTECEKWDKENPSSVKWRTEKKPHSKFMLWVSANGMLLSTCLLLIVFASFIYQRSIEREEIEFIDGNNNKFQHFRLEGDNEAQMSYSKFQDDEVKITEKQAKPVSESSPTFADL